MCVRNLSTFAPSSLRRAWGLHPPSQVGTRNWAALLRTRQAGTRGPSALPRGPPGTRPAGLGVAWHLGAGWELSLC